jgi:hypothetical protein
MLSFLQVTNKTLEELMKALLMTLMIQATFANFTYAKDVELKTPVAALNLSLEHLSLTPSQIKKRDKSLAPIYDNYQNVNLSSVANALEGAYGLNIYHHMTKKELNLSDKKNVMENAVRYYVGDSSLFNQAAEGIMSYRDSVKIEKGNSYYNSGPFPEISAELIEGNKKKWQPVISIYSPSILASKSTQDAITDFVFRSKIGTREAVYSTIKKPLFSRPVMSNFLEAMKVLNLKGLDATIVFTSGDILLMDQYDSKKGTLMYKIIYPTFSKLAPIPQASIFINPKASVEDIVEMLNEHAPKIYAYNKLFNANLLPSVAEINELLKKYPNIIAEVEKKVGRVKRENLVNAVQAAFLNVTYGAGALIATPIAIGAMAASAIFSPIFITTITTVVVVL